MCFLISCILHEEGIKERGEWAFANGVCDIHTSKVQEHSLTDNKNLMFTETISVILSNVRNN